MSGRWASRFLVGLASCALALIAPVSRVHGFPTFYFDDADGPKNWDYTTADWSTTGLQGSYNQLWSDTTGSSAYFQGTAGTVNVPGTITTVRSITFGVDGYTLGSSPNSGIITLAATNSAITTGNGTDVVNSVLAGPYGCAKQGAGTLILNAEDTIGSQININQGTLELGNQNALKNCVVDLNSSAGLLSFGTLTSATFSSLAVNAGLSLSLVNDNMQPVALTIGNNNYWGNCIGTITGPGSLTKVGSGTVTMYGSVSNSYAGDTKIAGGTLAVGVAALRGSTLDYDNYGGTLDYYGGSFWVLGGLKGSQNLSLPGAGNALGLGVGDNNQSTTYNGALSGNAGVAKIGYGTWTLSGANVHTGDTFVASGTLELANPTTLQTSTVALGTLIVQYGSGSGSIVTYSGGTLSFGSLTNATLGGLSSAYSVPLSLENESSQPVALTVGLNNKSTTYNGVLSGTGSLAKVGTGTLTLSAVNGYTGSTTVSTGTLNVTGSLANNGSGDVFVAANGAAFGGTILRNVGVGAGYAGFGSAATGGNTLGSTADLIDGTNNGQAKSLSMQWRERTAAEIAAGLASDVFNLSGMANSGSQTDQFTLRMSYSPGQLPGGSVAELLSLSGTTWENAVLDNIGGAAQFMGVASPDGILGHYGIDPGAGNTVWAVLDYNSQFAVAGVPEPSTLVLLAAGLLGLLCYAWRKSR